MDSSASHLVAASVHHCGLGPAKPPETPHRKQGSGLGLAERCRSSARRQRRTPHRPHPSFPSLPASAAPSKQRVRCSSGSASEPESDSPDLSISDRQREAQPASHRTNPNSHCDPSCAHRPQLGRVALARVRAAIARVKRITSRRPSPSPLRAASSSLTPQRSRAHSQPDRRCYPRCSTLPEGAAAQSQRPAHRPPVPLRGPPSRDS